MCAAVEGIREVGSKRRGFWSFYQIYDVDAEDDSRLMDLRLGGLLWMKATSKAIMGIAWKGGGG
ncbi:hypothetical protein B296_00031424 [Ensete ventricosum]|uniref:Uncharacterized protein n=1 Tax=Ensete ventricosum TaxID=4639 RepID=A0A426YIX6_ENSVE|nr:hypothetical protein B296_00031424 [Ensete ventricosum]